MAILILGPERIADSTGTHEAGEIVENPSGPLTELAHTKTLNPDTGRPYCEFIVPEAPPPPVVAAPPAVPDAPKPAAAPSATSEPEKP